MALGRKPIEIVNDGKHQLLAKAESWNRINLKEVAKVQNGFAFSSKRFVKSGGMPLIRIRDIDNTTTVDKYDGVYSKEFIVRKGDFLIGMDGDFKAAIWKGPDALLNQRVCRVIPNSKDYDPKFLFLCLQPFLNAINEETSSVTVKHLSSRTIEEIPLPFPKLLEQQAIVSKIRELFSEIEKGIESLTTAKQQLKTYRQGVLKWAFEGKLTNGLNYDSYDLHDEHDLNVAAETVTSYTSRKNQDNQDNTVNHGSNKGELPKGWKWINMGEVIEKPKYGTSKKCEYTIEGIGVLRIPNIVKGIVDSEDLKFAKFDKKEIETYSLREGDILTIRSNGSVDIVGKCALITKKDEGFLYAGYLIRLRAIQEKVLPKYLLNILSSVELRNQIEARAKSTSGVNNINSEELSGLKIPLPSLDEQNKIVSEIESRLSVADKMEESITQSLQQAGALKQSILKKAFEGKLFKDYRINNK